VLFDVSGRLRLVGENPTVAILVAVPSHVNHRATSKIALSSVSLSIMGC
jgi:hypothetical protein